MKTERAFETVWLCGGKELERRTVQADDMEAALVAAWMDLPGISRQDHKPCDTMRITCAATGQALAEDVPPFTLPPRRIGAALMIFVAGCVALWVGIWMVRHGWSMTGPGGKVVFYALMGLPMGWIFAILVVAMAQQSRQDAAAEWKKEFGDLRPAAAPTDLRVTRIVIAHFSVWRILPRLAILMGIAGALLWFPISARLDSGRWEIWHPFSLALGAALATLYLPVLRQMLFDGGAALWIQGGELVHRQIMTLSVPIWTIARVGADIIQPPKGFAYTAILLTSKDGKEFPIWPKLFRETPEAVAARLNALLRLSLAHEGLTMAQQLPGGVGHA